jgi:hypothetical protein
LATIVSAALDGVAEQALLDPNDIAIEAAFDVLGRMVVLYLRELGAPADSE